MPTPREPVMADVPGTTSLGQYCATDSWSGDLDTGLFRLKGTTRQILGLGTGKGCGLLTLVECFDPADWSRLLDIFERAASEPMRFSFATTTVRGGKVGQAVFCIGRSERQAAENGTLSGVFIFPHL